jgi:SAM-dependent methyltransferase
MDRTKRNQQTYDQVAAEYFATHRDRTRVLSWMRRFAEAVPQGVVLDLGAGPCEDSAMLRGLGLDVVSVDRSRAMLTVARQEFPGPRVQADLRELPFRAGSVAGAWACASLLHLERADMQPALVGIAELIAEGGALFVALKDGVDGKWDTTSYGPDGPRWYTYWAASDVDQALATAGFEILEAATEPGSKDTWHFRIARRSGR